MPDFLYVEIDISRDVLRALKYGGGPSLTCYGLPEYLRTVMKSGGRDDG